MKKLLSILLVLAMVVSLGVTAFAEGEKDEPDLKTFLSELAEKDKVTEEDLSELLTILGPSWATVLLKRSAPVCQMPTRSRRSLQRT